MIDGALNSNSELRRLYRHYRAEHEITHGDHETGKRLELFRGFLEEVKELQGRVEWRAGITVMAHMTQCERELMEMVNVTDHLNSHLHGDSECNEYREEGLDEGQRLQQAMPTSFDWRALNAVTPVKRQVSKTGTCWTHAAVTPMEAQMAVMRKDLGVPDLSTQELADCVYYGHGTRYYESGGHSHHAWDYIKKEGRIGYSAEIPLRYHGNFGGCSYGGWARNALEDYGVRIGYIAFVATDRDKQAREDLWGRIYLHSPVMVSINTKGSGLHKYKGGEFDPRTSQCEPGKPANHAVVIVGYDPTNYYIKNSWGDKWGNDGYIWWVRAEGIRDCSIYSWVNYPRLSKKQAKELE